MVRFDFIIDDTLKVWLMEVLQHAGGVTTYEAEDALASSLLL